MAAKDRPPQHHLTFLASAKEGLARTGLFPLVRGAEARAADLPRIGEAKRPSQNIVDLAHVPTLSFVGRTLDTIEIKGGRAKVSGFWLGLTGPMGPLPTHLTEFAAYEKRYAKARPFGDWLDLISSRMLQFFYRSWADSQPAALADREENDRFGGYLGALSGANEGVAAQSPFPARARLHYAALFAGRRSALSIEDALAHLLAMEVRILEFQPRWRDILVEDQSRVGKGFATLGSDAVCGKRVRLASDAFRVVIRTNTIKEFKSLLPSGPRFAMLAEALDAFAPKHLEWDVMLEIDEKIIPPAKLDGRSQLGWTGWVTPKRKGGLRADAHLSKIRRKPRVREGVVR